MKSVYCPKNTLKSCAGMGTILIIILIAILSITIFIAFNYVTRVLQLNDFEVLKKSIQSLQISLRSSVHSTAFWRQNFEIVITPDRFPELRNCINAPMVVDSCQNPFSISLQIDNNSPPLVGSRTAPVKYSFRGLRCESDSSDDACPIHFFNECVVRCPEKEPTDLSGVCPQVKRVICTHSLTIVRFFHLISPERLNSGFREIRFTLRLNNALDQWLYLPE